MLPQGAYSVLIADDSEDDRFFLRRILSEFSSLILHEVTDGLQALSYIFGENEFSNRASYPMPDLLLLDLKMPVKDGFEVLRSLKNEEIKLPVIVISSSELEVDQKRCVDLGASGFLPKAVAHTDKEVLTALLNVCLNRQITEPL